MLTYATRLVFSSDDDRQRLLRTLEAQRAMFNECSKALFSLTRERSRISIMDLHHTVYRRLRDTLPDVPAQVVIRAEHDCRAAYRSTRTMKHIVDTPHTKRELSMQLDDKLYSWKGAAAIQLTAVGGKRVQCGLVLYPKLIEMFQRFEVRDPLLFVRDGKVWLSIPFRAPQPLHLNHTCVGIDVGCRMLAVTSDGVAISAKVICKRKRELRFLRNQLRRAASRGSRSAKRHLKRLGNAEARYTRSHLHHAANILLDTTAGILVMEDLAKLTQGRGKRRGMLNRISQLPFFTFRQILTYKAQALGKRVVTVTPNGTSRQDSRGIAAGNRIGRRYYGSDGIVLDADLNAAINIAKRYANKHPDGTHPISLVPPLDGTLKPDRQAAANRPIVGSMVLMSDHRDCVALQAKAIGRSMLLPMRLNVRVA